MQSNPEKSQPRAPKSSTHRSKYPTVDHDIWVCRLYQGVLQVPRVWRGCLTGSALWMLVRTVMICNATIVKTFFWVRLPLPLTLAIDRQRPIWWYVMTVLLYCCNIWYNKNNNSIIRITNNLIFIKTNKIRFNDYDFTYYNSRSTNKIKKTIFKLFFIFIIQIIIYNYFLVCNLLLQYTILFDFHIKCIRAFNI